MGEPGLQILQIIGTAWPVVLILVGVGILLNRLRRNRQSAQ